MSGRVRKYVRKKYLSKANHISCLWHKKITTGNWKAFVSPCAALHKQ